MPASARSTTNEADTQSLRFGPVNLVLAMAGIAALVAGYWLLARGSITVAPILLVLGYVVLLPMAIIR
jgi:hypothetical protein